VESVSEEGTECVIEIGKETGKSSIGIGKEIVECCEG